MISSKEARLISVFVMKWMPRSEILWLKAPTVLNARWCSMRWTATDSFKKKSVQSSDTCAAQLTVYLEDARKPASA